MLRCAQHDNVKGDSASLPRSGKVRELLRLSLMLLPQVVMLSAAKHDSGQGSQACSREKSYLQMSVVLARYWTIPSQVGYTIPEKYRDSEKRAAIGGRSLLILQTVKKGFS